MNKVSSDFNWSHVYYLDKESISNSIEKNPKLVKLLKKQLCQENYSVRLSLACKVVECLIDQNFNKEKFEKFLFRLDAAKVLQDDVWESFERDEFSHIHNIRTLAEWTGLIKPKPCRILKRDEVLKNLCLKALDSGKNDLALCVAKYLDLDSSLDKFSNIKEVLIKVLAAEDEPLIRYFLEQIGKFSEGNEQEIFSLRDSRGRTLSHWVCSLNLIDLITKDFDLNVLDNEGISPLMLACQGKLDQVVSKLIDEGANIHHKGNNDFTALHYACAAGAVEIALNLIQRGAVVTTANKDGVTLLHLACQARLSEVALKLIEEGVDIHAVDPSGDNALIKACNAGLSEVALELIGKEINIHAVDQFGENALINACKAGLRDVALKLIGEGVNIHQTNKSGENALVKACKAMMEDVVLQLIADGCDVNSKDRIGNTILMLACAHGLHNAALELIDKGADVDAENQQATALIFASYNEKPEVVEKLLANGAHANVCNREGQTPLSYACGKQDRDSVEMLLKYGANINHEIDGRAIFDLYFPLLKEVICSLISDSRPLANFLMSTEDSEEFYNALEHLNYIKQVAEKKKSNPLKLSLLLQDRSLMLGLKEKYLTNEKYNEYVLDLMKNFPQISWENFLFEIDPTHFFKGRDIQIPPAPDHIKMETLLEMFKELTFDEPGKKGLVNLSKIRDDRDMPMTKENLEKGAKKLIEKIHLKEPDVGILGNRIDFYDNFGNLAKHMVNFAFLEKNPNARAPIIIDLCRVGDNCLGAINELLNMYECLSGEPPLNFQEKICSELQKLRSNIIKDWSNKESHHTLYNVHYANQYYYLLGKILHLVGAEIFVQEDAASRTKLTSEQALEKFYQQFTPTFVIDQLKGILLECYKDPRYTDVVISWFKDFPPAAYKQEFYNNLSNFIEECRSKGMGRNQIIEALNEKFKIIVKEQTPFEAIEIQRKQAFVDQVKKEAPLFKKEFYDPLFETVKEMGDDLDAVDDLFRKHDILFCADPVSSLELHQKEAYLCNIAAEWNKAFYDPLIQKIQGMEDKEQIRENLEAILKRRQASIIKNNDEENALFWEEERYNSIIQDVEEMEKRGQGREEISDYLSTHDIKLSKAIEFEALVQRWKGEDYFEHCMEMSSQGVFKGFSREAVLHLAIEFDILKPLVTT